MGRIAPSRTRLARLAAAAALLPAVWACEERISEPEELRTRIFRVTEADGQLLPAHHACPAPEEGVTAGTHLLEGELILYPERTYTWRYTVEQYEASGDEEQSWTAPVLVQGTYAVRGDSLVLASTAGAARTGRLRDDSVELREALPCHFAVADGPSPRATLRLDEVQPQD